MIFFRLPVATGSCFLRKNPPGSPLEAFGFRGGLGVEGAAPSCRDLETELDQRPVGEDPVCNGSCHF